MNRQLFDENLDVIKEHVADGAKIAARFRNYQPRDLTFIGELDAGSLNLVRSGEPLYLPDALTAAAQSVEDYFKTPERYLLDRPSTRQDPGTLHSDFRKQLYARLDQWELSAEPGPDAGYLISFGAGSGIHIPLMLQDRDIRNLVLVEPDPDLFFACLHILPWQGILNLIQDRAGSVRIILEEDPETAANWALQAMRSVDHTLVDGSYIYLSRQGDRHLDKTAELFRLNLSTLAASMGFFEDECLMFRNTADNLLRHDFKLMGPRPPGPKTIPAMIVGSGPSIDEAIGSIQRNADKTIVFSGGTAITVLKRNDVQPDFHTQYENVAMNVDVLEAIREEVGLDNTILIAPTTVDPRIPDLFEQTIFYFRDTVCPTKLFVDIGDMVPLSGPTVTNLACRAGLSFGITEFLLYGIDLGGPKPDTHHSKDSIYEFSAGTKVEATGQTMQEVALADPMNIPVEGNRRKRVYTSRIMVLARMFFEKLFTTVDHIRVYNCSDGVKIQGSQAVDPDQVNIAAGLVAKEELKQAILSELPNHKAGSVFSRELTQAFGDRLDEIYDRVLALLDEHQTNSILDLYDDIRPLLQQGQEELDHGVDPAARIVPSGTMIMLLQTGHFLYRRLDDPALQQPFMQAFCSEMAETVREMKRQSRELLGRYL